MTVGALTASIAHEVNQPLSGIITNASTCLRMLAADPPVYGLRRMMAREPCLRFPSHAARKTRPVRKPSRMHQASAGAVPTDGAAAAIMEVDSY
jgi:signal transduction histidine kinase